MKVAFEKVTRRATRAGVCQSCGKRRKQSKTFYQTISPFNLVANGSAKTREQIWKELDAEADKWAKLPPFCSTCMK
jgi:hypothetical protein